MIVLVGSHTVRELGKKKEVEQAWNPGQVMEGDHDFVRRQSNGTRAWQKIMEQLEFLASNGACNFCSETASLAE